MDKNIYTSITERCFVNAPFDQLRAGMLDFVVQNRIQPEIGLEGDFLWDTPTEEFYGVASVLKKNNLSCTLHAPFFDLAPGGIDKKILEITRKKLRLAFDLITVFQPESIVCHLGYEDNKHSYKLEHWLENSIETWSALINIAARSHVRVMFENTYETTPDIHHRLLTELNSPHTRFCLDTGHLLAYAGTSWQIWLESLLPWLGQLHLHDNKGDRDDHIAVGTGLFNFSELFDFLRAKKQKPLITLEPHSIQDLWTTLKNLYEQKMLDGFLS